MIDDQRIDDRVWFGLIEYIDDNIVKLIYVFPSPPLPSFKIGFVSFGLLLAIFA